MMHNISPTIFPAILSVIPVDTDYDDDEDDESVSSWKDNTGLSCKKRRKDEVNQKVIPTATTKTLQALDKLLNTETLERELQELKDGIINLGLGYGYKPPDTSDIIKTIINAQIENNWISSIMATVGGALIQNDVHQPESYRALVPNLAIYHVQRATSMLPRFFVQSQQLLIIRRAVQMEACRSLVAIYDWFHNTKTDG